MNIILDTNVLLVSLSTRSKYYPIYKALLNKKYQLFLSNEILSEYEEQIALRFGTERTNIKMNEIINLSNVHKKDPFLKWGLITVDPDDNKFVDCAIISQADYIVTNDRHFEVLKQVPFPEINTIKAEEFLLLLTNLV